MLNQERHHADASPRFESYEEIRRLFLPNDSKKKAEAKMQTAGTQATLLANKILSRVKVEPQK